MYIKSFKDKRHKNDTTLSSYLWDLKENHSQILKLTFTMGSYDGAEVCELLGIFILSKLENIGKKNTGVFAVTTD